MEEVEIIDTNAENISNFGFCAYKNIKQEGYKRKTDWLRQRFPEGMRFKVLRSVEKGDIGFIEYIPGEYTWRAIDANAYMVIHCILNIYHKFRKSGYGSLLLRECLQDAKKQHMHGVAVVTSKGPWMAGKDLFLRNGFEVVDESAPRFDLLVKKFGNPPSPTFKGDWEKKLEFYGQGLTIIHSNQCPYVIKAINEIRETIKEYGIPANIRELNDCKEAQNAPSPYGIFSLVYNGKLLVDHPISKTRFMNIINKVL
jgi:GNAT superfamily N-acetyltransferase